MARFAVIHMTQQLKHMSQSRALKTSLFQSHDALEGKQGLRPIEFTKFRVDGIVLDQNDSRLCTSDYVFIGFCRRSFGDRKVPSENTGEDGGVPRLDINGATIAATSQKVLTSSMEPVLAAARAFDRVRAVRGSVALLRLADLNTARY
jgi:hypothetical protein